MSKTLLCRRCQASADDRIVLFANVGNDRVHPLEMRTTAIERDYRRAEMKRLRTASWSWLLAVAILFVPISGYGETSDQTVRIGATISLSGKYSEPSGMIRDGYHLWAKQINARGGLLGQPVELILYDDKSDPLLVGQLYRKLLEEDRVDLILSPYGTPLTLEAVKTTDPEQMVMLATAAAGSAIWNGDYQYVFGM